MKRAERDAHCRRRWLLGGTLLYAIAAAAVIADVATGERPVQFLLGLPIPLLIAWYFLRQAQRVKIIPVGLSNIQRTTQLLSVP